MVGNEVRGSHANMKGYEMSTLQDPKVQGLIERCKAHNIIYDVNERWENGVAHHPKAEEIFALLSESDWVFCNDYFCWKSGGDGDNGETLMYSLSIMLELKDAESK